jgi:hypothetical protein
MYFSAPLSIIFGLCRQSLDPAAIATGIFAPELQSSSDIQSRPSAQG